MCRDSPWLINLIVVFQSNKWIHQSWGGTQCKESGAQGRRKQKMNCLETLVQAPFIDLVDHNYCNVGCLIISYIYKLQLVHAQNSKPTQYDSVDRAMSYGPATRFLAWNKKEEEYGDHNGVHLN